MCFRWLKKSKLINIIGILDLSLPLQAYAIYAVVIFFPCMIILPLATWPAFISLCLSGPDMKLNIMETVGWQEQAAAHSQLIIYTCICNSQCTREEFKKSGFWALTPFHAECMGLNLSVSLQ